MQVETAAERLSMDPSIHINSDLRNLNSGNTNSGLQTAMDRLSSGFRLNNQQDDVVKGSSGLSNTERHDLNVAVRNLTDLLSMIQTAESALTEINDVLERMHDLSVQSEHSHDRNALQKEVINLKEQLNRLAETTTYNSQHLLDGSYGKQRFTVGADSNEYIEITLNDMRSSNSNIGLDMIDVTNTTKAKEAVASINVALTYVNNQRKELNEIQNRVERSIRNLSNDDGNGNSNIAFNNFGENDAQKNKLLIMQSQATAQSGAPNVPFNLLG